MSKFKYILLSYTWGFPMSLIGCIVALVLTMCGYRANKFAFGKYFIVGDGWGGINFGPVFVVCSNPSSYSLCHEYGHSIQNCYFGLLFPFIVAIPSLIRFWWREYQVCHCGKKYSDLPPYDSIWFEGQATTWGTLNADPKYHCGGELIDGN